MTGTRDTHASATGPERRRKLPPSGFPGTKQRAPAPPPPAASSRDLPHALKRLRIPHLRRKWGALHGEVDTLRMDAAITDVQQSPGQEGGLLGTRRARSIATRPSYWMTPIHRQRKRGWYTREEAVLTATGSEVASTFFDAQALRLHAHPGKMPFDEIGTTTNFVTTLVRDRCHQTTGDTNLSSPSLWIRFGRLEV